MASPFVSRTAPELTKEQRKQRRLAWKPSSARLKLQKSGDVIVVFRSDARAAELAAQAAAQ
jgi:hypothetical protein